MKNQISQDQVDLAIKLYVQDGITSFNKISKEVGISGESVKRVLIRNGIEIKPITTGRKAGFSKETQDKIPEVIRLYVEEDLPLYRVEALAGVDEETIRKILIENKIRIKTAQARRTAEEQAASNAKISATKTGVARSAESIQKQIETVALKRDDYYEDRPCVVCGTVFQERIKYNRSTCSKNCEALHRSKGAIRGALSREWIPVNFCPCDLPLKTSTHGTAPLYCSDEHREVYSKYSYLPENQNKMFLCKNCDEWFEKRVFPSSDTARGFTYCSFGCASEDLNSWHGKQRDVLGVTCLSGLEEKFVLLCKALDIPVRGFNRKQTGDGLMKYTRENGQASVYGPDFFVYLYGEEIPVEVKGWYKPEDRVKVNTWRKRKGDLLVADEKVMEEFEAEGKKSFLVDKLMAQMDAHKQGLYDDTALRAVKAELNEPAYALHPERVGIDVDIELYEQSLEFWSKN